MPSYRRFARYVVIAVAIMAAAIVLVRIANVLLLGFGAVLFAVIIRAAGEAVSRVLPVSPRWGSVMVIAILAAGIALLVYAAGSQAARQVAEFQQRLPEAAADARAHVAGTPLGDAILPSIDEALKFAPSGTGALKAASAAFNALSSLFIVAVLAIYLSVSARSYVAASVQLVPPRYQAEAHAALRRTATALRKWFAGQMLSMLLVGVLTAIGLSLVGVPNAIVLGVIAGLLEFVPVIGTFVAAVPILLLALATGPEVALYALIVYFAIQQLEGALIMPLAQRWAVHLPPAITLLSVAVFGVLFGLPGVLFATPLAVVGVTLVRQFYLEKRAGASAVGDKPSDRGS